jgi:putative ABC transport system permease protein
MLEAAVIAGTFESRAFLTGRYAVIGYDMENVFEVGGVFSVDGRDYEVMALADYGALNALSAHFITVPGFSAYLPASVFSTDAKAVVMSATIVARPEAVGDVEEGIRAILAAVPGAAYRSRADYTAELETSSRQIAVIGMTLCVTVLVIGLLNYINTTMTGIISRRRELDMLRVIGMTAAQCRAMLSLEGLLLSLIAAAALVVVGTPAAYFLVHTLSAGSPAYTYRWTAVPFLLTLPPVVMTAVICPLASMPIFHGGKAAISKGQQANAATSP